MCTRVIAEARRGLWVPLKKKKKHGVTGSCKVVWNWWWELNHVLCKSRKNSNCWAISPAPNHRPFKVFFPCYMTELICITSYSLVIHKRCVTALFLMQANISHTCLLFPVRKSQISHSNMVSELNSLPDFWHLTPSKRSQHCKCRKGGVIPMTSHFHGMNRVFSDNSSFWNTPARREGPISENQQPSTHSFNHRPRGPEKNHLAKPWLQML